MRDHGCGPGQPGEPGAVFRADDRSLGDLVERIAACVDRVRELRDPTPLETIEPGDGTTLFLKREDGPPIRAYKWRGAFCRMALLGEHERRAGVVAASAGNHAQGVALAAARLGIRARIFMPLSTPLMKREAVARLGGAMVEIVLHGDSFDAAAERADQECRALEATMIHPYDDFEVIAGQGTIGHEITEAIDGADAVFLQIGGGGLAAGVGAWLRSRWPGIEVVGVEGVDQASMRRAFDSGRPERLDYVDVFSDGTAVRRAGDRTFAFCRQVLDRLVAVTNEELCEAIQFLWNHRRIITEPAGAMGVAAWLRERERWAGKRVVLVLCGANMDFAQLSYIARHAHLARESRRYFRFTIDEGRGTLLELLQPIRDRANIVDFQYGKTAMERAHPVIGMDAPESVFDELRHAWRSGSVQFEEISGEEDVEFRIIPFRPELAARPCFVRIEFPERAGALADFLRRVCGFAGICYFNYAYSGERVGRALLGFEFVRDEDRNRFLALLDGPPSSTGLRSAAVLPHAVAIRILEREPDVARP